MPNMTLLQRLKIDLGIINSTAYDERLQSLLNVAKKEIEREGVVLDPDNNTDDGELLVDYARFMWQGRRGDSNPEAQMPRNLRWRINNRLFGKERKSKDVPEVVGDD